MKLRGRAVRHSALSTLRISQRLPAQIESMSRPSRPRVHAALVSVSGNAIPVVPFQWLISYTARLMAKPRPEKKSEPKSAAERRVLPMELQVGDRLTDETGEWEIAGRPYSTNAGKDVHVRVKRVENAYYTMIRTYAAHEHVSVKRATAEEVKG